MYEDMGCVYLLCFHGSVSLVFLHCMWSLCTVVSTYGAHLLVGVCVSCAISSVTVGIDGIVGEWSVANGFIT